MVAQCASALTLHVVTVVAVTRLLWLDRLGSHAARSGRCAYSWASTMRAVAVSRLARCARSGVKEAWRRTTRCTCQSSGLLLWYMVKRGAASASQQFV